MADKIEEELGGQGQTDTKYSFSTQSSGSVKQYNEFAWFLVAKWYMHVGKTRFTGCSLEGKIEGKLNGHGETDAKYRF